MIAYVDSTQMVLSDEHGTQRLPTPAGTLTDPRFLLQAIAFRVGSTGRATIVLDQPIDWSGVEEIGWIPQGTITHWRSYRKGECVIYVVTLADRDEYANDPMTGPGRDVARPFGQGVAGQLTAWWRATGTMYYATPGVSAVMNLRDGYDGAQPVWRIIDQTGCPWQPPARQIEAIHFRSKRFTTDQGPWYRWDMRAAYLAAMAAVTLPFKALRPSGTEPSTLDCGYYRVREVPGFPGWFWPNHDRQGTSWVCQGTLALIIGRTGNVPEIVDSWTPRLADLSGHRRILRNWAEDWRDIHLADMAPWKMAYAQLVGLMNVPSGRLYRPDWRHMIIDQVRASMFRRILRVHDETSLWPVYVPTDSVFYGADVSQWLGVGAKIGNMRYEGLVQP